MQQAMKAISSPHKQRVTNDVAGAIENISWYPEVVSVEPPHQEITPEEKPMSLTCVRTMPGQ